jgi:hypothetical protein
MKPTAEFLPENLAAPDHQLLGERATRWIALVGLANLTVASLIVASGSLDHDHQPADQERQTTQLIEVTSNPERHVIPATTHPDPKSRFLTLGPKLKPKAPIVAHDVRPATGYRQKYLATQGVRQKQLLGRALRKQPGVETFYDISHPQCDQKTESDRFKDVVDDPVAEGLATAVQESPYGIIGVTGGRNFTANQCLATQLALFKGKEYDLYVNSSYPGYTVAKQYPNVLRCTPSERVCIAKNYGMLAGRYAVNLVQKAHGSAPKYNWFIDVEVPGASHGNGQERQANLEGQSEALKAANQSVGVAYYSVPASIKHPEKPSMWDVITGIQDVHGKPHGWRNGAPAWIGTGSSTKAQALEACITRQSFTGGPTIYSQYSETRNGIELDANVVCTTDKYPIG